MNDTQFAELDIRPGRIYGIEPEPETGDVDVFIESGLLMFLALVLSLIGYGLWVFFA